MEGVGIEVFVVSYPDVRRGSNSKTDRSTALFLSRNGAWNFAIHNNGTVLPQRMTRAEVRKLQNQGRLDVPSAHAKWRV